MTQLISRNKEKSIMLRSYQFLVKTRIYGNTMAKELINVTKDCH